VPASQPYWKGYLKLSFVSCPIALYPAISAAERVSFRQLNRRTGHRLKHKPVDSITGEAVDAAEKARGYELGENEFLLVEDRDLERARSERPAPGAPELAAPRGESPPIAPAGVQEDTLEGSAANYDDEAGELEEAAPIARPQNTRTIEIEHFVPAGQIDARYFEKPYYIGDEAITWYLANVSKIEKGNDVVLIPSADEISKRVNENSASQRNVSKYMADRRGRLARGVRSEWKSALSSDDDGSGGEASGGPPL
jgi:hypothetical protein